MTTGMGGDAGSGMNGGMQQGERLQEAAGGLVDQAARTAEAQASTTMTKVGETLEQVAQAIREAGGGLRENQPEIANIVDTAAERVEEMSSYLRDHEAGEAIGNIQQMARQQPAVVIGGGLALGLLVGRLLRSGSSAGGQGSGTTDRYGAYGGGYAGTTGGYAGTTGYAGGSTEYGAGTGYGAGAVGAAGVGVAGASAYDTGYGSSGVDVAATDTLGDTTSSSFGEGTGGNLGASDDFATTDTTGLGTEDILADDADAGRDR
ncbi:MAG TPA: hypothetical protein VM344_02535 [Vitreimonas sp.]|nr:hypothetical protein [Vitreimonas sp.]